LLEYFFEFWWMFPVAFCVCLMATSSSVEGAVFFAPIFIIFFPMFAGVTITPIEGIFLALSIEIFGFGSALTGYFRRALVDTYIAKKVLIFSIPTSIIFGFLAHIVPSGMIMIFLGSLMVILCGIILLTCFKSFPERKDARKFGIELKRVDKLGREYNYYYFHGSFGASWSILGGILVGLTGIGIGELASTSLIVRNKIPTRVAIGTGILIVFATVLPATLVHAYVFSTGQISVHWNILFMTVPAVLIGGQVSPIINSRIDGEKVKFFLSFVFLLVGFILISRGVSLN
tara:strand:+ start:7811 stop:8674 length:864 start_codon:yes stop_codon:yes gene_type:complete